MPASDRKSPKPPAPRGIALPPTEIREIDDEPSRLVETSLAASAPSSGAAHRVATTPIDPAASVEQLEDLAAEHLANGRIGEAADVYAALAARVPHQRAYGAAARILGEQASR